MATAAQTSESDLISRIAAARGNSEPESAPTEPLEAVDVSAETPVEESDEVVGELEAEAEDETEVVADAETDTDESAESDTETEDDSEDLYVEYNGREINLKDIEEWEQGSLRQADYTRKTQELADNRKAFESEVEQLNEKQAQLAEKLALLDVMTKEEELTSEQIAELREYEPEEYIKYQEKMAKRRELLEQSSAPVSNVDVAAESKKLFESNPEWVKDGKTTDAFTNDTQLMSTYARDIGFSDAEFFGP